MGIEPNADCLEATECTSFLLSPLEHFGTQPRLLSQRLRGEHRVIAARYPFRAMRDASNAIHWVHITPAEEKPIFKNRN
jgi:hypothetical protein